MPSTRRPACRGASRHRDFDYLAPREDRSGNLWFIRRPFEKTVGEVAVSASKDALLFPWRVAKGVFGFLDAFSKIYGREPMKPSGGPQTTNLQPDMGALWLHGRMVAISEARYDTGRGAGASCRARGSSCAQSQGPGLRGRAPRRGATTSGRGPSSTATGTRLFRLVDGDWQPLTRANLIETVCSAA